MIVEQHAKELTKVATAHAVQCLGGASGSDYGSWAEDMAQEALLILFERELEGKIENKYVAFNMVKQIVTHKSSSFKGKEARRRELEREHGVGINRTLTGQSAESLAADPFDSISEEEAMRRHDELSPLLYRTSYRYYIEGWTVCGIAETDGVTEDVIYKRLQRIRDIVTGDTNDE
jgi:DNA-directed RNA polymerase specialized sigma24 family protein